MICDSVVVMDGVGVEGVEAEMVKVVELWVLVRVPWVAMAPPQQTAGVVER